MPLAEFPAIAESKTWACTGFVVKETSPEQVFTEDYMWARVTASILVTPATDPVPARGPLFPAMPGTPAQYRSFEFVRFVQHSVADLSPDDNARYYQKLGMTETDSPSVEQSWIAYSFPDQTIMKSLSFRKAGT